MSTELPNPPHCDAAILHRPGTCEYCDIYPDWQALRLVWGVAFTGETPTTDQIACPSDFRRPWGRAALWPGNQAHPPEGDR